MVSLPLHIYLNVCLLTKNANTETKWPKPDVGAINQRGYQIFQEIEQLLLDSFSLKFPTNDVYGCLMIDFKVRNQ